MGHAERKLPMTAEEFLAWDETQTIKHEFVRGEVFAMTGAAEWHVTVVGNLYGALRRQLRGSPRRTFITDMKLRVEPARAFYYPDLMVTCSAADAADPLIKREPLLIVEVQSPSTGAYDRGEKFTVYRLLPSLREYAVIDPRTRHCDVHRLGADGLWVLHPFDAGQDLSLASVDLVVPNGDLWDEVPVVERPEEAP